MNQHHYIALVQPAYNNAGDVNRIAYDGRHTMCTLTILPTAHGFRLGFNRDESRTRPPALPPELRRFGPRQALLPIDPVSGGTWIGVNDAGLVLALMNVYSTGPITKTFPRSRGVLIPALLACDKWEDARSFDQRLDDFAPFRLVFIRSGKRAAIRHEGKSLLVTKTITIKEPILYASSGLGDEYVLRPRRALFKEWFGNGDYSPQRQDTFHRHSWPDRPHLSVCMRRPEACTVSYTTIEVNQCQAVMTYHSGPPDEPAPDFTHVLSIIDG
jgi:hypothetical protein